MTARALIEGSAAEIAEAVRSGRASALEITEATLAHVRNVERGVGAYLTVLDELARSHATRIDQRIRAGERLPLAGVPIAVKDNMCLDGTRTTCGSKILENWIAPYSATAVARMLEAGAVPIGKANCDEFAMGSSCENSALGVTRNPYDPSRVPGGSSGGSAAAVAAFEAAIGLGSDTGGSIREPGAFCNLIGFKPTYGRVSRYGLIAFASSLDQIGPLTRTVEDAALAYDAISGYDPMDATSIDRPVEPTAHALRDDLRGLRVGIVREFDTEALGADMDRLYREAYRDLERLGAELVEVLLPTVDYGVPTYYLIAPAECSSNLARFDGVRYGLRVEGADVREMYDKTRAAGFGPEVKRRILIGTYALSSGYYDAYYVRAQKVRTLMAGDFQAAFARCDLIACPAASCPAFEFNAKSDPYSMYLMDYYTIPMALAGLPALSVPCGWVTPEGGRVPMPIGLQLTAPLFGEKLLLGGAHAYEQATKHALAHKPLLAQVNV
ncbi:MAG TPA: Asp-tRNA(Asn)/Glu-tRNA(Gln) amidotransferase subunit GatA [Candidatus Cybelea sp.]|jgi:aspartyl-tRNA(Asn)/glutamyl-tRNA(Gln) amidotransferase subunit A|nr:Asp-tRNA(Asn)/Glu-tRNA(Gln) amidotransferase subunit GatA [Candidatus Cybelea sp.]